MSLIYPQGVISLRVLFEDFSTTKVELQKTYVWTVLAKNLKVNLNSYLEADTFSATIDYKNLPFDPRIIRSCGVSIYMENKQEIFQIDSKSTGFRALNHIKPSEKNIVFQGFADSDKIEFNDSDRTVTLEGRDFTSLLIDRPYLGESYAPLDRMDQVIRRLLDFLPSTKVDPERPGTGLTVEVQGMSDDQIPKLSELMGKGELDGKKNPRAKRSYWDHIQKLMNDSGLIAFVSLDKLVITKPRNLYNRGNSKVFMYGRNVTSLNFERKLGRQKGFNIRVVSLANIGDKKEVLEARIPEEATEEWSRETGIVREPIYLPVAKAASAKNQEQGSTDTEKPPFIFGSTPSPANASGAPSTEDGKSEPAPYITFKIRNINKKEQLVEIGQALYEQLGRQQIEGTLETNEMKIYSPEVTIAAAVKDKKETLDIDESRDAVTSKFFDATKFRVGTPIEIRIDQGDMEGLDRLRSRAARNKDESEDTIAVRRKNIAAFLRSRGYGRTASGTDNNIAEAMALSLTLFDSPFFTKAVQFTLDHENGFAMELEFINFIEVPKDLVEGKLPAKATT